MSIPLTILIRMFTPAGMLILVKASIVFAVASLISMIRL